MLSIMTSTGARCMLSIRLQGYIKRIPHRTLADIRRRPVRRAANRSLGARAPLAPYARAGPGTDGECRSTLPWAVNPPVTLCALRSIAPTRLGILLQAPVGATTL